MKKILIISSLYPNKENPIRGIFVKKQVEELSKDFIVKVYASEICNNVKQFSYWDDNVEVFQTKYKFPKFFLAPFYYKRAIKKKLPKIVEEFRPDYIHIHVYQHIPELYVLAKILKHKRIFVTFHNNKQIIEIKSIRKFYYENTLKSTLKKIENIMVVSNKVNNILKPYLQESNKVYIIGNGVESVYSKIDVGKYIRLLEKNNHTFKIISVGNLIKSKGFDLLIEAVAELRLDGKDIDLTIIGVGAEKHNLQKLINKYELNEHIRLLGMLNHDVVMNLYKYFDAFVLPSWSETFGLVYLEAMLAQIPVIGVKGEGIDGVIIDGVNGFLVKPKNIFSLKNKILELQDEKYRAEIAYNGYKTVINNYTLEKIMKKIKGIYER
jgi:glycosyltransferase involved in cell wall biosynthesis